MNGSTSASHLTVANEFASVRLVVDGRNSAILRIENTKTGESIEIDPLEIEAITRMSHDELAILADPSYLGVDGCRVLPDDELVPGEGEIALEGQDN